MPTYDYRCRACEHLFEHFQAISDPPLRKCPRCGKLQLQRLIGAGAGLIFKGSGFYITDYRSPEYRKRAEADSGAKPAAEKADPAKPTKEPATPSKEPATPAKEPAPSKSSESGAASPAPAAPAPRKKPRKG